MKKSSTGKGASSFNPPFEKEARGYSDCIDYQSHEAIHHWSMSMLQILEHPNGKDLYTMFHSDEQAFSKVLDTHTFATAWCQAASCRLRRNDDY